MMPTRSKPHAANVRKKPGRAAKAGAWLLLLALTSTADRICLASQFESVEETYGPLEVDTRSKFSHIRVRRKNEYRSLLFVRNSGVEAVESTLNIKRPHELVFDYTKFMFLSYLYRPNPSKVLIVGLGGGSMVHFLRHYDPNVAIDVVDIDPAIVKIADRYFGVRNSPKITIITADGLQYLVKTTARYDVIYMDAFLEPAHDTDRNGVPLRLKTVQFYKQAQQTLAPDGVVVFNLNPSSAIRDDVGTIARAFPQTYVYRLPNSQGLVAVGTLTRDREPISDLNRKAGELDGRFKASFSFREMAARLAR
jgi:spermidine synthase